MKRLYVRPQFRGAGLGRRLATHLIAEARQIGYTEMRLDTLESLNEALVLYRSLGFERAPAYNDNSLPGVLFLRLRL